MMGHVPPLGLSFLFREMGASCCLSVELVVGVKENKQVKEPWKLSRSP